MKNGWKENCLNCKHCDENEWKCKKDGSVLAEDYIFHDFACCELKRNDYGYLQRPKEELID